MEWGPLVPCALWETQRAEGQDGQLDRAPGLRSSTGRGQEPRGVAASGDLRALCSVYERVCVHVSENVCVLWALCVGIGTSVFVPVGVCPQQGHGKSDRCVWGPGGVRGVGDPFLRPDSGPGSVHSCLESPWPLLTPDMSFGSETSVGNCWGREDIFPPRLPFSVTDPVTDSIPHGACHWAHAARKQPRAPDSVQAAWESGGAVSLPLGFSRSHPRPSQETPDSGGQCTCLASREAWAHGDSGITFSLE